MTNLLLRFLAGGLIVSLFAMVGDVIRPKSLAGLFGAAPSVALATLPLTIASRGRFYAAQEAQTMLFGAAAFLLYAALASLLLRRHTRGALSNSLLLMPVWFGVAFGALAVFGGRP
jgi:hypothetical protein